MSARFIPANSVTLLAICEKREWRTAISRQHRVTATGTRPAARISLPSVQLKGLTFGPALVKSPDQPFTIGFAARDLSNAKGFDTFVQIVDKLAREGFDDRFVATGDSSRATYGCEQQWVKRKYNDKVAVFTAHLMREYPAAAQVIELPGKLPTTPICAACRISTCSCTRCAMAWRTGG